MHECWDCGTYCDCDGEDIDQPCPLPHSCINPDCGKEPGDQGEEDEAPADSPLEAEVKK